MNELSRPSGIAGDEKAVEVIRAWFAHNDLQVSLRLSMWGKPGESDLDERDAWGHLFADLSRHVANGLMQEHGLDFDATRDRIRAAFLAGFDNKGGSVEGTVSSD